MNEEIKSRLEKSRQQAILNMEMARAPEALNEIRVAVLGKKGELTAVLKSMKDVAPEDRPKVGQMVNDARAAIEARLEEERTKLARQMRTEKMKRETIDVTLPGKRNMRGHRHPNQIALEDLERVFKIYGEVDNFRKVASLIVEARTTAPLTTTGELDKAIDPVLPKVARHKFLAKVYQALRIEVNHEMRSLEKFLEGAADSLKEGGILAVITYHSLEDRMVKNFIRTGNAGGKEEKDVFGVLKAPLEQVNRKPFVPKEEEIATNTRARSAKLRVARKIAN